MVTANSAKFPARFSWWPQSQEESTSVAQVVCAGDVVLNVKNRRDAIEYTVQRGRKVGVLQAIFQRKDASEIGVAIVRRLRHVDPDPDNSKIVTKHQYKRFSYELAATDVVLDCVPINSFLRTVMLVPDMHDVVKRYGLKQRVGNLPDDVSGRRVATFFEIPIYKYTSLAEQLE